MKQVTVNNQAVYYRAWGQGKRVIVLLHGWPADSSHYEKLGPLLAEKGYHAIVPDLPGWGQTPPPPKAWRVSDYREWVHDFCEELGLKKFALFGHSFGGRVAIKYAIKFPYECTSLILCAAAGIKPDAFTLKRRMLKLTAAVGKKAFSLPVVNKLAGSARELLYKAAGTKDYLQAQGVMKETIVNVLEEDLTPLLSQISHSTLLLWGTEDGATPLSDANKMASLIPSSELLTFDGVRHNLPKLKPAEVAEAIDAFLKSDKAQIIE